MFLVISVYFNLRNILPKSGTFPPGHPLYAYIYTSILFTKHYRCYQNRKVMSYVSKRGRDKKSTHIVVEKFEIRRYNGKVGLAGTRIACFCAI